MPIAKQDFTFLSGMIKDMSGIVLGEDKEYLLEGRLLPVVRKHSLQDINALVRRMQANRSDPILVEVLEAMTTNESFFFRDIKPFERLRDIIIPELIKKCPQKTTFKIWCAACSNGQEPYSVLMTLREHPLCKNLKFDIVGTDLDTKVLARAQEGKYTQFEVQRGVPVAMLLKYFAQEGDQWRIKPDLRSNITFRQFNLLDDPKMLGSFDIVFCRNVLIYFDAVTKAQVLSRIAKQMEPHAVLFLGAAESLIGMDVPLKPYQDTAGIFCLK